jgi:hypothetical protein
MGCVSEHRLCHCGTAPSSVPYDSNSRQRHQHRPTREAPSEMENCSFGQTSAARSQRLVSASNTAAFCMCTSLFILRSSATCACAPVPSVVERVQSIRPLHASLGCQGQVTTVLSAFCNDGCSCARESKSEREQERERERGRGRGFVTL